MAWVSTRLIVKSEAAVMAVGESAKIEPDFYGGAMSDTINRDLPESMSVDELSASVKKSLPQRAQYIAVKELFLLIADDTEAKAFASTRFINKRDFRERLQVVYSKDTITAVIWDNISQKMRAQLIATLAEVDIIGLYQGLEE